MNLASAMTVKATSLVPHQRAVSIGFQRHADYYEQYMLKHKGLSCFHSLAELFNAVLLEGDPTVDSYVPQPFLLKVNGKPYTPDVYISRVGRKIVQELKPKGEFSEVMRIPLEQFFALHNMTFEVVSNESVMERSMEAENWLLIIQCLHTAEDYDSSLEEIKILETLERHESCSLDDFIDPGARESTFIKEVAVFRLLHRGLIHANLDVQPIDFDMELTACK